MSTPSRSAVLMGLDELKWIQVVTMAEKDDSTSTIKKSCDRITKSKIFSVT